MPQRLLYSFSPADVHTLTLPDDGSDVTVSLQQQLDAIPDGPGLAPTVINLPAGRYLTEGDLDNNPRGVDGIVRLDARRNLVIQGPSPADPATFFTTAPAVPYDTSVAGNTHSLRRHFYLTGCHNITLRNIRVEGSNYTEGPSLSNGSPSFWEGGPDNGSTAGFPGYRASWELEHAFDFSDCTDILLEDFEVYAVWGDGIYIGNNQGCDNVIIRRGEITFPGRQGIAVSSGTHIDVSNVNVVKGRRSGIDLEPHADDLVIDGFTIRDCVVEQLGTGIAALGRGQVANVLAEDLHIVGVGGAVICGDSQNLTRRHDWTLRRMSRSSHFGSPTAGIRFKMTDGVTIEDCVHPVVTTQSRKAVIFDDCQGSLTITGCDFSPGGCTVDAINGSSTPVVTDTITVCP